MFHTSAHRGCPLAGVLLCRWVRQALKGGVLFCSLHHSRKGALWVASCSVVQCVRCLMGQCLYCSAADAGMWGEGGYGDGSTPTRDSAVPLCFGGCLAFLHWHFPPGSPPSNSLNPSVCNQEQPSPWDCSTIPKLQLPAAAPSRRPAFLSAMCMVPARTDSHSV